MRLPLLLASVLLGACSVVGIRSGTEEPAFSVVASFGEVEIRRYEPRIAAETEVTGEEEAARSEGFRRLAGYIFGANSRRDRIAMTAPVAQAPAGERIAMTAPVAQSGGDGTWRIRFFMPASYTMETLPVPNEATVSLVAVSEETVAVLRFSGITARAGRGGTHRGAARGAGGQPVDARGPAPGRLLRPALDHPGVPAQRGDGAGPAALIRPPGREGQRHFIRARLIGHAAAHRPGVHLEIQRDQRRFLAQREPRGLLRQSLARRHCPWWCAHAG